MATPWTEKGRSLYRAELVELYIDQNKTITEVGATLNIKWQTVYDRLRRLDIPIVKEKKSHYQNRRSDIIIPNEYSNDIAEFFGIMLGDGHLSHFQVSVTLGTKEEAYAEYVALLMKKIFGRVGMIMKDRNGCRTVYIGSVKATRWLQGEGLVFNKVQAQVAAPNWVFHKTSYMEHFLRGFFDTDGSIYKLRFGAQISLTNHSLPLLVSLQQMLIALHYNVSAISAHRLYLTRRSDVRRFFEEIRPQNVKHIRRFAQVVPYGAGTRCKRVVHVTQ